MPLLLIGFVAAAVAGALLTPLVIRVAVNRGMYDAPPGGRRIHTEPIPRLGGIAVFAAMGIGLIAAAIASLVEGNSLAAPRSFFLGLLFSGTLIFLTGLVDDLRGLRPISKLVAQITAALIVYAYGFRVETLSFSPSAELHLGWLTFPITLLWIVGVTNAFNLIDGLDGLAAGVALVALGTTLTVSHTLGNVDVIIVSMVLLGAVLGFLRYNFNPVQIFLGDSGSLFLGFMLAVLSVYGASRGTTTVIAIVPLFALAIPLLDMGLAIVRRWLRGVPLSQADGRHIHHRLLAMGLTHRHAVVVLYIAASVLAVLGLSLVFAPPPAVISVAVTGGGLALLVLLYGVHRLDYHEFIEAGSVLASGVFRLRRVIRDQIHAQDVGQVISCASNLEEVRAVLADNAASFGFLHLEVCRENSAGPRPLVLFNGHAARAWKLDYPVAAHDFVEGDDYVLRIWCNPQVGARPYAAERVAQILAPVLERWITASMGEEASPRHVRASLGDSLGSATNEVRERTPIRARIAKRSSWAVEKT